MRKSNQRSLRAIHPGLMGEAPAPVRWVTSLLSSKLEQAAEIVVYYTSSPEIQGMAGIFFKGKQAIDSSPYTKDQAIQQRLWEMSTARTHLE